jgi:hypothetical protein
MQQILYWLLDMRVYKKIEFTNNPIKIAYALALFCISFHCKIFLNNNTTPFYYLYRSNHTATLFGQKWHVSRSCIHINNKRKFPAIHYYKEEVEFLWIEGIIVLNKFSLTFVDFGKRMATMTQVWILMF